MALIEVDMFSNQTPTVERTAKKQGRVQDKRPSDKKKNESTRKTRKTKTEAEGKMDTEQKTRNPRMLLRMRLVNYRQEEIDLSESAYFQSRSADNAARRVANGRLMSDEFLGKVEEDENLPENWFRYNHKQPSRNSVVKEYISPCRRIIRCPDGVRAYLDLTGKTKKEVDKQIEKFSKRTRAQYEEAIPAKEEVMKWACGICPERHATRDQLRDHNREKHKGDGRVPKSRDPPSGSEEASASDRDRATSPPPKKLRIPGFSSESESERETRSRSRPTTVSFSESDDESIERRSDGATASPAQPRDERAKDSPERNKRKSESSSGTGEDKSPMSNLSQQNPKKRKTNGPSEKRKRRGEQERETENLEGHSK